MALDIGLNYGQSEDILYEPIFGTVLQEPAEQNFTHKIGLCHFKHALWFRVIIWECGEAW